MADKKELAEQIAKANIKNWNIWRKEKRSEVTAAIIEAMGEKPEAEIEDKYKIDPELEKITGWRTGAEWMAFDEGYNAYDSIVIEQIEKWDGRATNSGLYDALKKKFEAMGVQPNLLNNEQNDAVSDTRNDAQRYTAD